MRFKSRKALAQHHTFVIDIYELSPWPSLHGPLVVEYQRGSKKRGYSDAAEPIEVGTGVTRYEWGSSGRRQQFVIDASLYPGKDGGLEQKLLNIYVCQVDDKGKPGNMVGGIVLDLAQLVGLPEHSVRQEYDVECSQSIVEMAGSRPRLVIGLRQQGHDGNSKNNDNGNVGDRNGTLVGSGLAPLVVDGDKEDIPSRLSTEIPSSERRMDANEESVTTVMSPSRVEVAQRGFKTENGLGVGGSAAYDEDGFLVEDDQEYEEGDEAVLNTGGNDKGISGDDGGNASSGPDERPLSHSPMTTTKNLDEEFRRASLDECFHVTDECDKEDVLSEGRDVCEGKEQAVNLEEGAMEKGESTLPPLLPPDLSPFRASNQKPVHKRRFSRDINSSFGSMRQLKEERLVGSALGSPSVASCGSAMKDVSGKGSAGKSHERLELEILAAIESAVWCAGYHSTSSASRAQRPSPSKIICATNPHLTAARRLARTVIALGATEGLEFTKRAVNAIRITCASSLGDVRRLVLWWAALITLRVRFFTLTEEDGKNVSSLFEWLKEVLPIISEAEGLIYAQIVENVWDTHLAPVMVDNMESSVDSGANVGNANNRDIDEQIERIISGLDAALDALNGLTDASVSILKTLSLLVLEDVAVKLDVLLLKGRLLTTHGSPDATDETKHRIDSNTGLEIKMLVSKLVSYLESRGVEGASLPRMDSLSNVLVSHKASLLDAEVRKAIAPRISLNSILSILQQYTMSEDEGTTEDLDSIRESLKAKASTTVDLNATYEVLDAVEYTLPDEHSLSQQGIVQSLSLEMNEDSEDELDELIGDSRKGLLLELWGLTGQ